ncbi:SSI family serine proteinase inhibitor [Thermobifida cellulosilytica]|uniref:SSI family serine proteinase inhibitor n=1 Tax=Thermobifida cellulosilytica TaxID=144786 RepID=UPI000837E63F|nr:SSI family serine proteinase inhibitor [Thermobifida cellulosilytica]
MRFPALSRTAAALAVAACLVPLTSTPAAADSPADDPHAFLTLVIQPLEGTPSSQGDVLTLECGPDGGTHPTPEAACDSLRAVDGDFEALPTRFALCPPVIWPVRFIAVGHWDGRGVYYSRVMGDRCSGSAATDGVFPA